MKRAWITVGWIVVVTATLIYVLPVGLFGAGILVAIGALRIAKTFWG